MEEKKTSLGVLKCQAVNVWLELYLICVGERVLTET